MSGISLSAYKNWVPPTDPAQMKSFAVTKWAERTPEDQAASIKSKADLAATDALWAEEDRKVAADAKGFESNYRTAPNVSSLTREQSLKAIEYMSELIQSGEAEKTPLNAAKGQQTTSNYRQYVSWLQQHVKELEGAQSKTELRA